MPMPLGARLASQRERRRPIVCYEGGVIGRGPSEREATMTWEYKTLVLSVAGFMTPKVDAERIDTKLTEIGRDGWELVSALDTNAGHGSSYHLVAIFKRAVGD